MCVKSSIGILVSNCVDMEHELPQAQEVQGLREELQRVRQQRDDALSTQGHLREQEVLLRNELAHRVRNALSVIRSVYSRTAMNAITLEELNNHYLGRLDTIARYSSAELADGESFDLESMVWDELMRFPTGVEDIITVVGARERLPRGVAQALGLALHELATNSVKFGALRGLEGSSIAVSWSRQAGDLVIEWLESGPEQVDPSSGKSGFGREYLEQALPYQISAVTSLVVGRTDVHCSIQIPAALQESDQDPSSLRLMT